MDSVVHISVVSFNPSNEENGLGSRDTTRIVSSTLSTNPTSNQNSYWNFERAPSITGQTKQDDNNQVSTWISNQTSQKTTTSAVNGTNQYSQWVNSEISTALNTEGTGGIGTTEANTAATV